MGMKYSNFLQKSDGLLIF